MSDDLDALLAPTPGPPPRRDELFRMTSAVIRRRMWVRRVWQTAAVGLVFAAGVGVGWVGKPVPPTPEPELLPVVVPVLIPSEEPPSAGPVAARTPAELELDAEQADGPASTELYRRAGDGFLTAGRIESAVRCYRLHLSGVRSAELMPDDSWLLVSLKNARRKEADRERGS